MVRTRLANVCESCLCDKNFAVHFKLGVGTPQWDVSTLDAAYKQAFESNHLVYSFTCLLVYYLRNFAKFRRYVFLTSLNVAQKVKKFKTLTSVKKFLRSLTDFFGKSRKIFLLKKKKVFLQRKNFLLQRKKILLQRKFSGERSQKKEGSTALL